MKLCLISDTHEHLPAVPACDVLVIAGDFIPTWTDSGGRPRLGSQGQWITHRYSRWAAETPAKNTIIVPGNHCEWAKADRFVRQISRIEGHKVLLNGACEIDGVKFWGSPNTRLRPTPTFPNGRWAFEAPPEDLQKLWQVIDPATDILITHQNPALPDSAQKADDHVADQALFERAKELCVPLHVWGHEHSLAGSHSFSDARTGVNAALTDDSGNDYVPFGYVWVAEYNPAERKVTELEKVEVPFTYCRNKYRSPYEKSVA